MIQLLDGIGNMRIVVDETYVDYIGKGNSIEQLVEQYPNLLILKSVSKFYALSGMRIGYAVTSVRSAKQFQLETPPYSYLHQGKWQQSRPLNPRITISTVCKRLITYGSLLPLSLMLCLGLG